MSKFFSAFKWLFCLCLLLFVLLYFFQKESLTYVNYEIGGIKLDIPRDYHLSELQKRGYWPKVNPGRHTTEGIEIDVILPNLDAINKDNENFFKELGWGKKVRIRLKEDGIYPLMDIFSSYEKQGRLVARDTKNDFLEAYDLKRIQGGDPYRELYVKKNNGKIEFVSRDDLLEYYRRIYPVGTDIREIDEMGDLKGI